MSARRENVFDGANDLTVVHAFMLAGGLPAVVLPPGAPARGATLMLR